ncbi:MAG: N-6 DNA methylase [Bacteroidales bacterium]|nr:N-6 DNA methylase [Bacteroidales bacterium]MCF8327836.1 N-6 DNA methylase [Bacteroidales bacterium]
MSLYDSLFKILKQHRGVAPLDVVKNTLHKRFSMHLINDYLNSQPEDFQVSENEMVSVEAGFASFKELFFNELRTIQGTQGDHENFLLHFLDLFKEIKKNRTDFKIPGKLFREPDKYKDHVRRFMDNIRNLYERRILYHSRFITLLFEALYTDQFLTRTYPAPDSIVELFSRFTPQKKEISIYNPAAGGLKLLMGVAESTPAKVEFKASERNHLAKLFSTIYATMLGYFADVDFDEPEQHLDKQISAGNKYDYIISVPPFGVNTKTKVGHYVRAPQSIISLSLALFKEDTRGVFLLPAAMLDIPQPDTEEFRKEILESGKLHTVIVLPRGILQPYTEVQPALLLFQRKEKPEVRFLDASTEEFYSKRPDKSLALDTDKIMNLLKSGEDKDTFNDDMLLKEPRHQYASTNRSFQSSFNIASEDTIRGNRYSLNAYLVKQEKYFSEEQGYVRLGQLYGNSYDLANAENDEDIPFVGLKDLNGMMLTNFEGFSKNNISDYGITISGKAFLIGSRVNMFKPTWLETDSKAKISDNVNILGIRADRVHPPYLLRELNSEYCLEQMKQLSRGAFSNQLRVDDLLKVRVILPALEEQKRLVPEFGIDDQEGKGVGLKDFVSLVKHETGNKLLPLRTFLNKLPALLHQYDIPEDAVYAEGVDTTISQKIQNLKRDLEDVYSVHEKLEDIFYKGEVAFQPGKVELISCLKEALRNTAEAQQIDIAVKTEADDKVMAEVDREKFVLMLQNIVRNVADHNNVEDDILLETRITEHENNILINFMNTGNGLPTGFSDEDFTGFRKKSADSPGQGLGGFLINKIVEIHGGSLHILSPETDFVNNRIFAFNLQIVIPKTQ